MNSPGLEKVIGTVPQKLERSEVIARLFFSTGEEVDMVVVVCCTTKNHAVGVECCSRDGSTTMLLQET